MGSNLILDSLHRLKHLSASHDANNDVLLQQLSRLCKIILMKQRSNRFPDIREQKMISIIVNTVVKSDPASIVPELYTFLEKVLHHLESVYHLCRDSQECEFVIEIFSVLLSNGMLIDACLTCISSLHQRGDHPTLEARLRWRCRKIILSYQQSHESYDFLDAETVKSDAILLLRYLCAQTPL